MRPVSTSARVMKRALTFALLLAVFAPTAAIIASACAAAPCCAGGDDRIAAPMNCCAPTLCAAPSPARQPKSGETPPLPTVVDAALEIASGDVTEVPFVTVRTEGSAPHPTRVRLALIATLLI